MNIFNKPRADTSVYKVKMDRYFVTREMCGRMLRLRRGVRYIASVPLAVLDKMFAGSAEVTISRVDRRLGLVVDQVVSNLTRAGALELLAKFNNRKLGLSGRIWK